MEAKFNINTSQNVNIELKIAGVGDRLVAVAIDYFILTGVSIGFMLLFSAITLSDDIQIIVFAIYGFVALLYHFFMEWLFKGQTIGKKYRKIRVIHKNGSTASVFQLLIRNLIRFIDSIYGLGLLVIFFTKKSQRLGDLAAATVVVKDGKATNLSETAYTDIAENYKPTFSKLEILRLDEKDMEMIKEITDRSIEQMNWPLVEMLSEKIKKKAEINSTDLRNLDFLKTVLKDFQVYAGE